MSSVILFHDLELDAGNIRLEGGAVQMDGGLSSAVYLSVMGGNADDDGSDGNPLQWWGNLGETEPARRYRSELQYLLTSLPATSANLLLLEEAARRDLQWMLDENIINELNIAATIPKLNAVKIAITGGADGQSFEINFLENWKAST